MRAGMRMTVPPPPRRIAGEDILLCLPYSRGTLMIETNYSKFMARQ